MVRNDCDNDDVWLPLNYRTNWRLFLCCPSLHSTVVHSLHATWCETNDSHRIYSFMRATVVVVRLPVFLSDALHTKVIWRANYMQYIPVHTAHRARSRAQIHTDTHTHVHDSIDRLNYTFEWIGGVPFWDRCEIQSCDICRVFFPHWGGSDGVASMHIITCRTMPAKFPWLSVNENGH